MWIWMDCKSKNILLNSTQKMNNTFLFLISFRSSCDQRGSHESKSKSWRYSCLYLYRNRRPDTYHYMEKGWKTYSTKVSKALSKYQSSDWMKDWHQSLHRSIFLRFLVKKGISRDVAALRLFWVRGQIGFFLTLWAVDVSFP